MRVPRLHHLAISHDSRKAFFKRLEYNAGGTIQHKRNAGILLFKIFHPEDGVQLVH